MLCAYLLVIILKDVMYLSKVLIYLILFILFCSYFFHGTSCKHRCCGAEVIYVSFYLFLFVLFYVLGWNTELYPKHLPEADLKDSESLSLT